MLCRELDEVYRLKEDSIHSFTAEVLGALQINATLVDVCKHNYIPKCNVAHKQKVTSFQFVFACCLQTHSKGVRP